MASGMANMVKDMHTKGKKGKPAIATRKPRVVKASKQAAAPATDDMGLGNIIGLGAKTIIGVGLMGGLAGAMGGMHIGGGGMPPGPPLP
jgi:hypothetical protein